MRTEEEGWAAEAVAAAQANGIFAATSVIVQSLSHVKLSLRFLKQCSSRRLLLQNGSKSSSHPSTSGVESSLLSNQCVDSSVSWSLRLTVKRFVKSLPPSRKVAWHISRKSAANLLESAQRIPMSQSPSPRPPHQMHGARLRARRIGAF